MRKARYTRAEINHMVERYPHATLRTIAAELGRTLKGVKQKAKVMQLARPSESTYQLHKQAMRAAYGCDRVQQ